jgi:hypothetical protein
MRITKTYQRVVRNQRCGRRELAARTNHQAAEDGRCRTYGPPERIAVGDSLLALEARLAGFDRTIQQLKNI